MPAVGTGRIDLRILLRLPASVLVQKGTHLPGHRLARITKQLRWQDVLQRLRPPTRRHLLLRNPTRHLHPPPQETRQTLLQILPHLHLPQSSRRFLLRRLDRRCHRPHRPRPRTGSDQLHRGHPDVPERLRT